jgi:hypothetical protein
MSTTDEVLTNILLMNRAFAVARQKNREWDSRKRGLHATLLQRSTWRSIRDAYFAPPAVVQAAPKPIPIPTPFPPQKRQVLLSQEHVLQAKLSGRKFITVSYAVPGEVRVL